jgi:hypothetical protein
MKIKSFKYFYPEKPVLISIDQDLFEQLSDDPDWIAEPKYNGQRCCLWVIGGNVEFWGRHGKKLKYNEDPDPEMVAILTKKFPKGIFLFDAELRHNKVSGIRHKIVIWDVFIWRGEFLNRHQYWTRRAMLNLKFEDTSRNWESATPDTIGDDDKVSLIRQHTKNFRQEFLWYTGDPSVDESYSNTEEFEGLVLKNVHGMLNIGRTSAADSDWMFKVRKPSGRYKF